MHLNYLQNISPLGIFNLYNLQDAARDQMLLKLSEKAMHVKWCQIRPWTISNMIWFNKESGAGVSYQNFHIISNQSQILLTWDGRINFGILMLAPEGGFCVKSIKVVLSESGIWSCSDENSIKLTDEGWLKLDVSFWVLLEAAWKKKLGYN